MNEIDVSIIVPTYKEARNITPLAEQIDRAMKEAKLAYEMIVVDDDSNDGIIEAVEQVKEIYNIKLKVRKDEKGLSSAVIAGYGMVTGKIVVVMDADLSHPPAKIPELVFPILAGNCDFMIGSRFIDGGSARHFNWYRRLNAWISRMLARPFTFVSDPMAGFFAFHRSLLRPGLTLNPLGFKIGLEMIVKASPKKILEVPIQFQERLFGESKLSLKEQLCYLIHLKRLFSYKYETLAEFTKFCLIGSTGMLVDLAFVYLSMQTLVMFNLVREIYQYRIARVTGFAFAVTTNFLLNRRFTFLRAKEANIYRQYLVFIMVSLIGFAVNWFTSVYLYEHFAFFNEHYLLAALMGIFAATSVNFVGNKLFVFKRAKPFMMSL